MQCWSARMMQNEGKETLPEPNRQEKTVQEMDF